MSRRRKVTAGDRARAFRRSSFRRSRRHADVDHVLNDTTSILRLITKRFGLPMLPGIAARDAAFKAHGVTPGNLTEALNLRR